MPRIRTLKPEFWADEKLCCQDVATRLVFLGLISMADDTGRLVDNVKQIDALLFPVTRHTTKKALEALHAIGRIDRGETPSGQRIIQIVNWKKHQRIDHPNLHAALPEIARSAVAPREPLANDNGVPRETFASRSVPTTSTNDQKNSSSAREDFLRSVPVDNREAITAAFRASHHPDALLASLKAIVSGLTPPAYPPAVIGQAVQEMAVAGAKMSVNTLRAFCRKIVAGDTPPTPLTLSPSDRVFAAAAELDRRAVA